MNYRHTYHAGNFADVMKHGLLLIILKHLLRKSAGFCALDTHAGCGMYDLNSHESYRTGEWHHGIGLFETPPAGPGPLTDYLQHIRTLGAPKFYPGSPNLIASVLRPQDRLICCELHPEDAASLKRKFRDQSQVAVHERDGYAALKAFLPPRDVKRGLTLIDPPFEVDGEFDRLVEAIRTARQLFPMGIVAAWYPIKHRAPVRRFHNALRDCGLRKLLDCTLLLREPIDPTQLNGCGLLVASAPYRFEVAAQTLLSALAPVLSPRGEGRAEITWIVEE